MHVRLRALEMIVKVVSKHADQVNSVVAAVLGNVSLGQDLKFERLCSFLDRNIVF